MARSYRSIVMDFEAARRQARELDEVADNLSNLSGRQFEGTLEELSRNWTGDNSLKYIGKGRALQGNMDKTSRSLREVASAIRQIAEAVYEAEMEAWERAHDRD